MMNQDKIKTVENKRLSFWGVLLLSAVILPALNELFLGIPVWLCEYYGLYFSYSAWGNLLTLAGEITDVLYTVVSCICLVAAVMTMGFFAARRGFSKAVRPATVIFAGTAFSGLLRIALSAILISLGISDKTASVGEQILPGLPLFGLGLVLRLILTILLSGIFSLVGKKTARKGMLAHAKTLYMRIVYLFVGLYTLAMLADALVIAFSYNTGEGWFTGIALPFVYPLIYGTLMVITALLYRDYFGKKL